MSNSWVYLFSKFSNEAILIELFFIFSFTLSYVIYWFVKRRKADDTLIPAGVIKNYLNALIADAENLRAHLFGLLGADSATTQALLKNLSVGQASQAQSLLQTISISGAAPTATTGGNGNLSDLEKKLAEQSKALELLIAEKTKLEKELSLAKTQSTSGKGGGVDPSEINKLQEKINNLEGRLAEYSVIEDDLANLKRLQQENAQLKAQLAGAPAPAPAPASAAAPSKPAAVTAAPAAAPEPAPAMKVATTEPVIDPAAIAGSGDLAFEGLVDQVEESLKETAPVAAAPAPLEATTPATPAATDPAATVVATAPAAAAPIAATPAPEAVTQASTPAAAPATLEKSDADLVAEFEKMLNG